MPTLIFYYSKTDPEIKKKIDSLEELKTDVNFALVDICIDDDRALLDKFQGRTPVLQIGPYTMPSPFEINDVKVMIGAAIDRDNSLKNVQDDTYLDRVKSGQRISKSDRFGLWFTKHYIKVIILLIALFVGIPFLAPVLARNGNPAGATIIYKVYRPLCHQLAFRSFFLYGEQWVYPRELAHVPGLLTYEEITGSEVIDVNFARDFIGNDLLGYKVAICERDVAIYLGFIIFGIVFEISKRRIKGLPWYVWFIVALLPIGIDGFSQLPSLAANPPLWLPIRESTPLIRIITGALFGIGTGWYLFPIMEETMLETRTSLVRKIKIVEKVQSTVK